MINYILICLILIYIYLFFLFKQEKCVPYKSNAELSQLTPEQKLRIIPNGYCKDCGYPKNCHGEYKGDSWRHIYIE